LRTVSTQRNGRFSSNGCGHTTNSLRRDTPAPRRRRRLQAQSILGKEAGAPFGVAFQYAPLRTKNCDTGSTCSGSDKYVGIELRLHLVPYRVFCPWISVGVRESMACIYRVVYTSIEGVSDALRPCFSVRK
jgi:hypothetical protein